MMTRTQWMALPEMLRRRDVLVLLQWDERTLEALTREVQSAGDLQALPARTIAAIRPSQPNGEPGRRFYFKSTLEPFMTLG